MVLYLIRHGETAWNKQGLLQGQSNISLNNEGKKEALKLKEYFQDKEVNICLSSPLNRAYETAKIIFPNLEIIKDDLLIERYLGDFEGKSHKEYHFYDFWNYQANNQDGNVESVRHLLKRSEMFLNKIKEKYSNQTVAIVSHGAFLKALHYSIIGYNENTDFSKFSLSNCEFNKYEL